MFSRYLTTCNSLCINNLSLSFHPITMVVLTTSVDRENMFRLVNSRTRGLLGGVRCHGPLM